MKTILLPREWNSPDEPPTNTNQVMVKYGPDEYDILFYDPEEKEWCETTNGDAAFLEKEDALDSILGWALLIQQ